MDSREELIAAARGEVEVDCLLAGGRVANVLSGEVHRADVAIHKGRIAGFDCQSARCTIDLEGMILAPGFIDGHVHIESAMVTVPEYAKEVLPRGTTSVIADPHEIANVWGEVGIRYMLESSRDIPLNVFIMLPSCVPATDLETSGALAEVQQEVTAASRQGEVLYMDHRQLLTFGFITQAISGWALTAFRLLWHGSICLSPCAS